jgi:DNA polymerase I-like protein with 3'-5' exonuclease and polymerase domains
MKHRGIVNVPGAGAFYGKQMRRCFIADEGKVLVSVDADACQNRMLGQRANSPELTEILLGDSHTLVMNAVNSVLSQYGLPLISRGKAKGFGFAYRFGASDNKLGEMAGRNSLGAEIRDAINAVFPNQAELLERLTKEWRSNAKKRMNDWGKMEFYDGWITGLDGRPIHIKQEHTILVFMLQSDEAIFMSAAYCIAYKKLCAKYKWGEQFGITLFYHDEFTVECDKDIAEDVKLIMEESLSISSDYYKMFVVPQTGTADVGHNWLEVH